MAFTREKIVVVDRVAKIFARPAAMDRLREVARDADPREIIALPKDCRNDATRTTTLDLPVQSQDVSEQVDARLRSFIESMAELIVNDMRREREKK